MLKNRKLVIGVLVTLIVLLALLSVVPIIYSALTGPGVRTEPLDASKAQPATTDVNGEWVVAKGRGANTTSVGYTFHEVLPAEKRVTSGSTQKVTGEMTVVEGTLTEGSVAIDLGSIESDNQRRDVNVRNKILKTETYPQATFHLTGPVDISGIPDDGTVASVTLPGELTIKETTKKIEPRFDAVRDGKRVIVSGTIPILRSDYGVDAPDFVAAKIDDEGELNVRLALEKVNG